MRFLCMNDPSRSSGGLMAPLLRLGLVLAPLFVLLPATPISAADAITTLACPDPGSAPIPVGLPAGGMLEVAPTGTLCTLTEILSDPSDPTKDIQVIPIARSYNGRPWESVAGFRSEAVFSDGPPFCTSTKCDIVLPAEENDSRYVLSSYDHSLGERDEIARFLDQMTFGVKKSELDSEEAAYDAAAGDASAWRAQFLQNQMDLTKTPLTSHREWWRKRTNPKMAFTTQNARSDGPCDKNSRWRLYTFTRNDFHKPDDGGDKRVVRFYRPQEDEGLSDPVIYEAEDLALVAPPGQIPLIYTLNEQVDGFYGLCEGDCDADSDCSQVDGPRVCYQRSGMEAVPGCFGYGSEGTDYCVDPQELEGDIPLTFTGNPLNPNPGGTCEGDCDNDSQCAGELKCKQRTSGGPVPGCYGHEAVDASDDFCYDPTWSLIPPPYFGYKLKRYSGVTYLEHDPDPTSGESASWLEWNINVDTAGVYPLSLRFSQPRNTEGDMFVEITVNAGSTDEQRETLLTTYSVESNPWLYTDYMQATLMAGDNTVRIRNLQEYGANIDHLRLGKAKSTIIEVDGHYRTVVNDQIHYTEGLETNSDGQSIQYSDSSTQHNYEICDFPQYYNVLYPQGRLRIRPEGYDGCGSAQQVDSLNPLVNFSGFENYVPGIVFDLPNDLTTSAWKPAADVQDSYKLLPGYDVLLVNGIENNDLCSQVPASAEEGDSPILAKLPDGTYLQWSPQLILEENTMESPFSDGGGDIALTNSATKCMNAPRTFLNEEHCALSDSSTACPAEGRGFSGDGATVICGSAGEVSNDHSYGQLFDFAHNLEKTTSGLHHQKVQVWAHLAVEAQDQLRQKVAWALSSIFTVVCDNIDAEDLTEVYLSFFDIFVRNAFGNFKDVLKEASYSPLMATHLTYLDSKSHAFIFGEEAGKQSMADENYAREVMQLFTIGLNLLNSDGTSQKDANGKDIPTYSNEDIMSFSRAWTGFQAYSPRGNYEETTTRSHRNLLDPLNIVAEWRDRFPKTDLTGGYIGDTFYPLCTDLPEKMFLRKGARYRLLGSNPLPELMIDHPDLKSSDENPDIKRMVLESSSNFFAKLYNGGDFKAVVELDQNLNCFGTECDVDTVRTVQVASDPVPIFYEYVAPPCVYQAFYEGGKQIARGARDWEGTMCADPRLPAASEACGRQDNGGWAFRASIFTGERMTYDTAAARCASMSSGLPIIPLDDSVGNDQGMDAYGHCQGDCDADSDCRGTLVCMQRESNEEVPGCASSMSPEALPVISLDDSVGGNKGLDAYGHCQGDCDKDSDCRGDLVCFQRDGDEDVPGCSKSLSVESLPVIPLAHVGNNEGTDAYGHCQGDCDLDSDCQGLLQCFQRSGNEEVSGCISSVEIAEPLPDIPLDESVGNNKGENAYDRCQGDCDRDSDCKGDGDLYCFQRGGDEPVPGCTGTPASGRDYCVQRVSLAYGQSGSDYCYMPENPTAGTTRSDYCVQPSTVTFGSAGTDYCYDAFHESGAIKYGKVSAAEYELGYHWTSFDCSVEAKINTEGRVALVHETDNMGTVPPHVNADMTLNYFNVYWNGDGSFPSPETGCGSCRLSGDEDGCICPTQVMDEIVFSSEPTSVEEILSNLFIGAVAPDVSDPGSFTSQSPTNKEFTVHFPQGSDGVYTSDTIFELRHPYHNTAIYLKNSKSTVSLKGWEQPTIILEGEDAIVGGSAVYVWANETSRAAFTGTGYMQFDGTGEGTLDWTLTDVPAATVATISFRYENTMFTPSPAEISVNDVGGFVELESTGVYENWIQSEPIQISLTEGSNSIQLKHSSGITSFTKIDSLKIEWGTTTTPSSFRNAPHFMGLSKDYGDDGEGETAPRDAYYETDAVLDHYFYHPNVAPFICTRLIQRHGVSNPSPGYVGTCSEAFRSGSYISGGVTFGSNEYGSLEATMAAIALEPEATSSVLDADAGHGHIREPFLQPIQMLRSLEAEFTPQVYHYELQSLFSRLGQEPHHFATVFSWFLPEYQADVGPSVAAGYVAPESMIINMPSITAQLNGLNGLIKYGVSDCNEGLGFGESTGYGTCYDDGSMQSASSFFSYTPTATDTPGLVQELNTLLCAGRLKTDRQNKIVALLDDYNPAFDEAGAKLRFAYQLIISTPEFHTNTVVKESASPRPGLPEASPEATSNSDYKAVVLLYLDGGVDSFNMLPPLECQENLYDKYTAIRGGLSTATENPGIALPKETLHDIPTNNENHVCSSVGLHPNLPFLKQLYDDDQAIFVCNAGLLQYPATKDNYQDINVPLFSHNSMSKETKRIDLDDEIHGTGVLGRMRDKLSEAGYATNAFSISGSQPATLGKPGVTKAAITLSPSGLQEILPRYNDDDLTPDLVPHILGLNNATAIDSPFMSETWSAKVSDSIYQLEEIQDVLETATVTPDLFPPGSLCDQLKTVAKVMSTHQDRGSDRDLFYVSIGGWDTHSNAIPRMEEKFGDLNACLEAFVTELNDTGLWESTVLAQFSEFGRTLDPNSGRNNDGTEKGADHAWGGNHFVIGGGLKGGQVLGQYPTDFTTDGPLVFIRGRIIPTTPWDSTWNAIAPWMGVPAQDLDYVLPMKKNFDESVHFTEAEFFV